MFSASVSFPNKKDMDAFIAAFARAKACLSPLSTAAVGGIPVSEEAAGGPNANSCLIARARVPVSHGCQELLVVKRGSYRTCCWREAWSCRS
jgi:hypothetical protein